MTERKGCEISIRLLSAPQRKRWVSIIVNSKQTSSSEPVAGSIKRRLRSWKGGRDSFLPRPGASLARPLWGLSGRCD